MLYGQNLPWRAAIQRSSRNPLLLSRTRISSIHSFACIRSPLPSPLARTRSFPSLPAASLSRFSTSTTRWKEKPPGKETEEVEEKPKEESEQKTELEKPVDEPIEVKEKIPEPIPKLPSQDGKAAPSGGAGGESGSSSGDGSGSKKRKSSGVKDVVKQVVPDVYPQVLAIPIGRRPLFPGFYKNITIRDKGVARAVAETLARGQPYVGVFMLKDPDVDKDVIDDPSEVHDVGTFCQITQILPAYSGRQVGELNMGIVLYPHRRVKLTSIIPPNKGSGEDTSRVLEVKPTLESTEQAAKEEDVQEKKGDVVASFEESEQQKKEVKQYEPTAFLREMPVSLANITNLVDEPVDANDPPVKAITAEIVEKIRQLAAENSLFQNQVAQFASHLGGLIVQDPAKLSDFAAAVGSGDPQELQEILAEMNIPNRLQKSLYALSKELETTKLQSKISKDVESKIQQRQREYFLTEQMKGIKRELGLESDGKDKLLEKFKEKAAKLAMPEAVKKVFDEEINKLMHLEPQASEFNVTRNYLDWLTQIPWGQRSAENFGIKNAMKVLDEDHHGLKDVKDRILEFIAVGKLRGTVEGKILCMVGPPGVGKTSIGKSIARALNRQYYRFSVGGLTDVAEIKGHRRTYVGALPGRIIQALKKCQTENPLVLIDEVDKIGRGHQGDPSSALLELLDPEQNSSFLDHYMDVPVDLSKVLFVCTANMTDTIPRPLLDRMEMIELSGYVADEKMAIAERYLAPQAKELSGLKDADVIMEKDAIQEVINKYARESGVRNLKKQIEKVYRKAALKIVKELGEEVLPESEALTEDGKAAQVAAKEAAKETKDVQETPPDVENQTAETPRVALKVPDDVHVRITKDNLKDYVGPPVFTSDRLYDTTPPGVAMGLAWTSMGGSALYIETILESALSASTRGSLTTTGNLKSVMKESTSIAYSFAKGFMASQFPGNRFFEHARLHLHCPEGAVQKDGPSAGITMATSLLSLGMGRNVESTIAMTGELTVTGKVLRIGGLREKTVAARRAGAEMVIFPKDNLSDWLELPENIKANIQGHPVSWYSEVFDLVFPSLDRDKVNGMWKKDIARGKEEE
ncbi:lon protease like, mitochondrial, partial [Patellaria atrata CBS 101060]